RTATACKPGKIELRAPLAVSPRWASAPGLQATIGADFAFRLDCFRESACASVFSASIHNGESIGRTTMRRFVFAFAAAVVCAGLAAPASAQYPDRAIKMIVPWAAGGDTDNIFRPFAPLLQKHIGQPIVIANVGGASGTVGAREAKGSAPDGYTLYAVHDYIHLTYYAGIADVKYTDFE